MAEFNSTKYYLKSLCCGKEFQDSNWELDCPEKHEASLIKAVYDQTQLHVNHENQGIYIYSDWLPVSKMLVGSGAPVTYKSKKLARYLNLENLHITFNGYWPEKGAFMRSGTFKECEAFSVCARTNSRQGVMVVASAGNTARAFARICSENKIPLLITIPYDNIEALWSDHPLDPCVKIVACESGGDYFDAINIANIASGMEGFFPEGGAKNVARRDGMGTTVLSATTTIGRIPDYYFQAIGSGTGAIAAWEANQRFIEDGRYGSHKMKLMLSQNDPFVPIKNSWDARSSAILPFDDDMARRQVEEINAKVLSNRKPPYAIKGGLFDALTDTDGVVYSVTNEEAESASELFQSLEGNDLEPAAAVAVASLIQAVKRGDIRTESNIMLNITGGGIQRFIEENKIIYHSPSFIFPLDCDKGTIQQAIYKLFNN